LCFVPKIAMMLCRGSSVSSTYLPCAWSIQHSLRQCRTGLIYSLARIGERSSRGNEIKMGGGASEPGWIQGVRPVSHAPSHKTAGASGIYSSMLFISPYTIRNGMIYKPKSHDVTRKTRHNLDDGDRWQLHSRAWPRPLRAVGLL